MTRFFLLLFSFFFLFYLKPYPVLGVGVAKAKGGYEEVRNVKWVEMHDGKDTNSK